MALADRLTELRGQDRDLTQRITQHAAEIDRWKQQRQQLRDEIQELDAYIAWRDQRAARANPVPQT